MDKLSSSQIVQSFGPGAMVDLPEDSILIAGLDSWRYPMESLPVIQEPRLLATLPRTLDRAGNLDQLRAPPRYNDAQGQEMRSLIVGKRFPNWFIVQHEVEKNGLRRRRLVHNSALESRRFRDVHDAKKVLRNVVPVRFVRACTHGHIGDIAWMAIVHQIKTNCPGELWLEERGSSGEMDQLRVICGICGEHRDMARLVRGDTNVLGGCDGARPWLNQHAREECKLPSRLLVRSASNAYFPMQLSVISIPDQRGAIDEAVAGLWDNFLSDVEDEAELVKLRNKPLVRNALLGLADSEVFQAILRRRNGGGEYGHVKELEFDALSGAKESLGEDDAEGDFFARQLPKAKWTAPWMKGIERVVLVQRLREVTAMVGFTRFEATSTDLKGELQLDVERAAISIDARWLPAVENRGEGIFLQFSALEIERWLKKSKVLERGAQLSGGFESWKKNRGGKGGDFHGQSFYLLHSLSHILMTQLSLDCGYPASSLRERLYCLEGGKYGILIYTASNDAQGTLGGLIEAGREIKRHFRSALEMARLCSNDPVCAGHQPSAEHDPLNGAACHACLFVAETSCEQRNQFLDRCLVVPTVENVGCAFFEEI